MKPFATRIVVGVDTGKTYAPVVGLIERLAFPSPHLLLLSVAAERLAIPVAIDEATGIEARYAEAAANLGCLALQEATNLACGKNLPCDGRLIRGNPASRLIQEAERAHADLIAINTKRCGVARSSYIGSVARALAIGSTTSVLIAKGQQGKRGTFRAVFATDHSPFADRCLERFLELAPKGVQEVHVVSAWRIDDAEASILGKNLASLGGDADRWIEERIEELNGAACAKLEAAGYRAVSHVERGEPNEVIHKAMADIRADLLVVGSQGHGAMERAPVGSVSLHQTTAEFYPVLIVRPREA